jgi:hypothetical protein
MVLVVNFAALALVATMSSAGPASPGEVTARLDELWKQRDRPAAATEARQLLDAELARAPSDYQLLWRSAAWHFWRSDDPQLPAADKTRIGKLGWDVAERAVAANPGGVEGHFWAAATMGNYSLGIGVLKALTQGIEKKFRSRLGRAESLNRAYAGGAIQGAWGSFYAKLPWPKRDVKKAFEYFHQSLEVNADNLRTRVFTAELLLEQKRAGEAKKLLGEVLAAPGNRYDPPEERRAKVLAAQLLRRAGAP